MKAKHLIGAAVVVVLLVFLGSCVDDFARSTPESSEVTIINKQYSPEHWDLQCSTDSKGYMSCQNIYYPPSWAVWYEDGPGNFYATVAAGTYDALRLGDRKVVHYALGGGLWHARYNEQFVLGQSQAEAAWPTR
jgi:hypothetical protein